MSNLSPDTSKTFINVSSEHVAKTDLVGWQVTAFSVLEWEPNSHNTYPIVVMSLTWPFAIPTTYKFSPLNKVDIDITGISLNGAMLCSGFQSV